MDKKKPSKAESPKAKPRISEATRRRLAEKARQQWKDPSGKLRQRYMEGRMRLRKKPPRNACELIERACAEFGASQIQIAKALNCSRNTFMNWVERHPEIAQAFENGRAIEESKLTGKLFDQAMKGNSAAAMFLLKSRFGYRDGYGSDRKPPEDPRETAEKIQQALAKMREADGD